MIAPAEQPRVGAVYRRLGYAPIEETFQRDLVPEFPFPASDVQVIDDVLEGIETYRAQAMRAAFADVPQGPIIWRGIADPPSAVIPEWIATHFPGVVPELTFLRRSPAGQPEPHFIHCDKSMGQWTALLYLTERPAPGDGTTFWRNKATDQIANQTETLEAYLEEGATWNDVSQWAPWYHVPATCNRLVMFPAAHFHSRALAANYGNDDSARLIQVTFGGFAP
jgi:hypothetical protein